MLAIMSTRRVKSFGEINGKIRRKMQRSRSTVLLGRTNTSALKNL
jgi:hypothetical protein